jgi:hypothetical protein
MGLEPAAPQGAEDAGLREGPWVLQISEDQGSSSGFIPMGRRGDSKELKE